MEDFEIANTLKMYLKGELFYNEKDFFSPRFNNSIFIETKNSVFGKAFSGLNTLQEVYSFVHDNSIPGSHFPSKIKNEIDNSKIILVLVSKSTSTSKWVNFEVNYAYKAKKIIIPIILEPECNLPDLIKFRQAILAYQKPQYWIIDLDKVIKAIHKMGVADRLEFDKKTKKPLSFLENLQLKIRDIYGFDLFKIV